MKIEQLLEKYPDAEQLIKEIPENAVRTWWGKTYYPGSEYWRLSKAFTMPRLYKNMGLLRQAETLITDTEVVVIGGGFGGKQVYPKGHYKYNFYIAFFDALDNGKYIGWQ